MELPQNGVEVYGFTVHGTKTSKAIQLIGIISKRVQMVVELDRGFEISRYQQFLAALVFFNLCQLLGTDRAPDGQFVSIFEAVLCTLKTLTPTLGDLVATHTCRKLN